MAERSVSGKLILKRGKDGRVRAGHPWIYRGEVAEVVGAWKAGEAVSVLDSQGRFLGRGFYNPRPSLVCRLLTRRDEPVAGAFFRGRVEAALALRRDHPPAAPGALHPGDLHAGDEGQPAGHRG